MDKLATFKSKGKIKEIGKISTKEISLYEDVTFLPIKIEIEFSSQILDFYITEKNSQPSAFKLISKHFHNNGLSIDDELGFDFNIVKNKKDEFKLKIWGIYNLKRK